MKRQEEVSEVFAEIVVKDLVTLENMNEMMYGDRAAQTRELMKSHLYKVLESPVISTTLRLGLGRREYGQLKTPSLISQLLRQWCHCEILSSMKAVPVNIWAVS